MASPPLRLPSHLPTFLLIFSFLLTAAASSSSNTSSSSSSSLNPNNVRSICQSTPYPISCLESQKLSISNSMNPSILNSALRSLQFAISTATKLSSLLSSTSPGPNLVESQKRSLQDCRDLHQITLSSLKKSAAALTAGNGNLADVPAYLSAALTNKATCLEGLAGARGSLKPSLVASWAAAYEHVSNSLSLVARSGTRRPRGNRRRLLSSGGGGFPAWVSRRDRRLLQSGDDDDDGGDGNDYEDDYPLVLTVAADGTGNFTTIGEAIAFAPSNNVDRTVVAVCAGLYEENVEIPSDKSNIALMGEGSDVTVIRGSRSVVDGWTTFSSATVGE